MSGIKVSRKLIMDQLDMVGLADRSNSKAKTFSQGMKQRLGIAVALVHDPALLILDEPTNGLDPAGIRDMRDTIPRLAGSGVSVILSSHILAEVQQVCSSVTIISEGALLTSGPVADLIGETCR